LQKHGVDAFEFAIVSEWPSPEEACLEEIRLIAELNSLSTGNGYNLNGGGFGGVSPILEVRQKIGNANKGRVFSSEARKKISDAAKRHGAEIAERVRKRFLGSDLSDEHKAKLSSVASGKIRGSYKLSDEARFKQGATNRGKNLSKDHREKISNALKGKKITDDVREKLRGKTRTPEQRERYRLAALKRWKKHRENQPNKEVVEVPEDAPRSRIEVST